MVTNKKRGRYYTPPKLAKWISQRVLNMVQGFGHVRILEPSCGDGVFFRAIEECDSQEALQVDGVEIESEVLNQAQTSYPSATLFNKDFLLWNSTQAYDIILGNPPYISKKNLTADQATACKNIHIEAGLANREISNIWTSFVVKSSRILSSHGIMAFVIPTELLQVKYAQEIRTYLLNNFERIEIISFKKLAFETLEQDTVILIASKTADENGFFFTEVDSIEELCQAPMRLRRRDGAENTKWTSFILDEEELSLVDRLNQLCKPISSYCSSVAGIVTAANNYFIVSQEIVDKYSLNKHVKPIIQKGMFVNGAARYTHENYEQLRTNGKPCFLLDLNGVDKHKFNQGLIDYLAIGTDKSIHTRYKCSLRQRWHDVPSIWKSEGFFFKRGHEYPKVLDNQAKVLVTDAAYRIRMNDKFSMDKFVMSFYNSLTLLCSELYGRYYGGGVLEITPNEFKTLPLPYTEETRNYRHFLNSFEAKENIETFLQTNDRHILHSIPGITNTEIGMLQQTYKKVKCRRLRTTHNTL
ncbi:N-6 DNA methylase [Desulfovibrio sp. UCD-KL4C]|uniref:Eco57I restriction-modification methylase domain-containing protein n=1 Tax=Desulfovibrio sp. UCD-KL4C TaxID=2578120 RepID=UPI0025C4A434|nr:N-6 DNA methylase [Desulfovibrio sp. UCD-KL4C]